VDPEVGRRDESPLAGRARVRPLLRVNSHVQLQVAGLDELFLADAALERLYAGVRAMVNLHVRRRRERATAYVTTEAPLAGMHDRHVPRQVRRLREPTLTDAARERTLARVNSHVTLYVIRLELLAADRARKSVLVGLYVTIEARPTRCALRQRQLGSVCSQNLAVFFHSLRAPITFCTHQTHVRWLQ